MTVSEVLDRLDYTDCGSFLRADRADEFRSTVDFGHVFRKARKDCNLRGVYSLVDPAAPQRETIVPVVYVCEAKDEGEARKIHRQVWNQNVVPFLIVVSPKTIRLYPGFRYDDPQPGDDPLLAGALHAARSIDEAMTFLDAFRAQAINDGTLWDRWGREVSAETRVDWRLLGALNDLDAVLQADGLSPTTSHALIGKYVYLSYLRRRDILSNHQLERWGVDEKDVFSRRATLSGFRTVVECLEAWLNGSTFPLDVGQSRDLKQHHIRQVARTFAGDDPSSGQMSLEFGIYDFSFIPIETLSVIYEQFLHAPREDAPSRGKPLGAYYTPIPLVNFMLEELDVLHPLKQRMRVLDPACGSGAFLVQCYRRIIEQDDEFEVGKPMRPSRLRELLEEHIFGIDRDGDACRVAELSLCLTLLDYVDPPDLRRTPRFQLPDLHGTNIHEGDFFDPHAAWRKRIGEFKFDWIVGNPPWIELKRTKLREEDRYMWAWMANTNNKRVCPIGGNQVAEAFAWKVCDHLASDGRVALLLPAMTLFKDESTEFRKQFFRDCHVQSVANFANLAYVLFTGHRHRRGTKTAVIKSERPAAAFFYGYRKSEGSEEILVFSPLVAEQLANRPQRDGSHTATWNIIVDSNQVSSLRQEDACRGDLLAWKIAMWGSHLDRRLLTSVETRFESLDDLCKSHGLLMAQGFELRESDSDEKLQPVPELIGEKELRTNRLRQCGLIFEFPDQALAEITSDRAYLRVRGGREGVQVSQAPHIIVDKLRRFAVYSDRFIAVPPRQIGIAGNSKQRDLLKALSLYLISDFAIYHQFLNSPEWGVSTSISTLDTLRSLPVPLGEFAGSQITEWSALHSELVAAFHHSAQREIRGKAAPLPPHRRDSLLRSLNDRVADALGLRDHERWLIHDLVHVRMKLIKGKVAREVLQVPSAEELTRYASWLGEELDGLIDGEAVGHHDVAIVRGRRSAVVAIEYLRRARGGMGVRLLDIEQRDALSLDSASQRARERYSQWVYFNRNLHVVEGDTTFVFKPLERLNWTVSQAILDAGMIFSEEASE